MFEDYQGAVESGQREVRGQGPVAGRSVRQAQCLVRDAFWTIMRILAFTLRYKAIGGF